jgi:Domain of unknown function (DUF4910)
VLPGQIEDEFLISAHICHPSLCNDNLSGVAVAAALARILASTSHRYTYRFLFAGHHRADRFGTRRTASSTASCWHAWATVAPLITSVAGALPPISIGWSNMYCAPKVRRSKSGIGGVSEAEK